MEAENIFLLSLTYQGGPEDIDESLKELERLTATAGGVVIGNRVFSRNRPYAALFFGTGQVEALKNEIQEKEIDLLIVDHELKPSQQRNLEEAWQIPVIDRTQVILDIFARRAKTHEGKLQVELAQLSYGKGTELSRLGGGIGTRGPGETKLEQDRRRVRTRVAHLKKQLETLKRTRKLHRLDREAVPLPLVSLVGYTNAGKSALLRSLTGEKAFVEDKLFATLDLSTRKLVLPPSQEVLLTDTVGFIRRLPHHLVAAFRGTLEEVVSADLLLHVIDCAHPDWERHIQVVEQVLADLGAQDKPSLYIFNKIDKVSRAMHHRLCHQFQDCVLISALHKTGLKKLLEAIKVKLAESWQEVHLRLDYAEADIRALVLKRGRVIKEHYGTNSMSLHVELPAKLIGQIKHMRKIRTL
jgi:GTPase